MSERISELVEAVALERLDSIPIARSEANYRVPTSLLGDGATFTVAGDDASARVKAKADYICDGTADNAEIEAALNALTVGRTFKERVRLVGSFVLSDAIVMPSFTIFDMREAYLIRDAETTFNIIEARTKSYVDIIGGIVDGNDANVAAKGNDELTQMNVLFQDTTYCSVRGIRVINATQNGIYFYDNCLHNLIEGNWIDGNRRAGILLFFQDAGDGPKHNIISGNTVINTLVDRHGIYLSGVDTKNNIVIGNIAKDNGGSGIRLITASKNLIVSNYCEGNADGINISTSAHDNKCTANYCYDNDVTGMYFLTGCFRNSATGNIIEANGAKGLRSAGKYTRFCDNAVYNNQEDGIVLETGADYSAASNNLVLNNSQGIPGGYTGITLSSVTYCTVGGNVAVDDQGAKTQYAGIFEVGTADYNIITNNVATPNRTKTVVPIGANSVVKDNLGYVTENGGTSAAIATGGTIAHGLEAIPTIAQVNAAEAGPTDITISVDATDITVNFGGGGNRTFFWSARIYP